MNRIDLSPTTHKAEILAQRGSEGRSRPPRTHATRASTREKFLSIPEVAERLGTSERFPRRLIEERRIEYKKFGSHVRIAESVLDTYIESCTVAPVQRTCRATGRRAR